MSEIIKIFILFCIAFDVSSISNSLKTIAEYYYKKTKKSTIKE